MKKIGIIGMGVSGLGILLALSKCDPKQLTNLDITCFDDTEHFGRGIPFQDDDASALINSPIDDISFDYQHMGDFKEWLEENGYETDSAYVSRALYGQYMIERMDDLLKQLAVTVVKHHVEDLHYLTNTSQWQVKVNGDPYEVKFDKIHLACGQLPEIDPYQLEGQAHYVADPYPITQFERDDWNQETVAIIGTGLAAVDVIKWFSSNTSAKLVAFSRSNYFPTIRILNGSPIDWQYLTQDNLEKLLAYPHQTVPFKAFETLFKQELTALGLENWETLTDHLIIPGIEGLSLALDYPQHFFKLQHLASRVADWFTDLWPRLTQSDRQYYTDTYGKFIVNLRNPMPAISAQPILEAATQKRLSLIPNVTDITANAKGFDITTQDGVSLQVSRVINATGYQLTPQNITKASSLLQSLLDQRLLQIDDQGGISVLAETAQVISPRYGTIPNLYAHGALINGTIYQNNSTIKIQKIAERAIQHMQSNL